MPKNASSFGNIDITPLSGQFDIRSVSGTMPISDFRIILNASMNEFGKRCRRPGWIKYGAGSPRGFNNQDLHSKLDGSMSTCVPVVNNCLCTGAPDCLRMVDYVYGVVLGNCVNGENSSRPAWDGTLTRTGDCSWGFPYYNYSFGGKNAAAIVSLISCENNIPVYQFELIVRLANGSGLIVWKGTSSHTPVGTYEWVSGCDETPTVSFENCGACTIPLVTASPSGGSTITEGSYVSLFSTEGATIFFTTDGSAPDNTSELYVTPFQINENTTVKAIAYTASCVSEIESFIYTVITGDVFLFEFTCDDEDQAGIFDEFNPNGSPDYNWRLQFTLPIVDITLLEIYETNSLGAWVTGQSWATKRVIYPVEMNGNPFTTYPIVVYDTGVQVNTDYTPALGNIIDSNPAGSYEWMLYGQPFIPLIGYFKLIFTYKELGVEKKIYSVIPHDCGYYYY